MNTFIAKHYADYPNCFLQEQVILSDLSKNMYEDVILFFNTNKIEKATSIAYALASWVSTDINYFLKISRNKIKMYEYDFIASLQFLGQLIGLCEDFKQWNTAYTLQKEYAKLNIRLQLSIE